MEAPSYPLSSRAHSGFPTTPHQPTATYAAFLKESRTTLLTPKSLTGNLEGGEGPAVSRNPGQMPALQEKPSIHNTNQARPVESPGPKRSQKLQGLRRCIWLRLSWHPLAITAFSTNLCPLRCRKSGSTAT